MQDGGLVVGAVARGVNQRHHGMRRHGLQKVRKCGIRSQFGFVARPEFRPAFGRVGMKPFAQFVGWGDVLCPQRAGKSLAGNTSRPQPVYQNPEAVVSVSLVIGSFSLNLGHVFSIKNTPAGPKVADRQTPPAIYLDFVCYFLLNMFSTSFIPLTISVKDGKEAS